MRLRDRTRERGAVMVMVALWLPVMAIFASFAIDAAHFWDFSRNLQNRVDASVLAAGTQFGGSCFGTPTTAELNSIGQAAQKYSGAPVGTPSPGGAPNGPNLPYAYSSAAPYQNLLQNPLADPKNFFLVLNGSSSYDKGGRNFDAGNFCSATYDGQTSPTVDAWLTQKNVPFFFNFVSLFGATISAHARVQLQGAASTNSIPVAVPDPAQTPCLRAALINDQTGALVNDANNNPINVAMTPPNPTGTPPTTNWTVTLPRFTVPTTQLSVAAYIPDDCNNPGYPANGTLYDSQLDANGNQVVSHGVEFINTYAPLPATLSGTNAQIGSVYLVANKNCDNATEAASQDPYFYYFPNSTTNGCSVTVCADVKFGSGLSNPKTFVNGTGAQNQMNNPGANGDPCMISAGTVDPNAYWLSQPIASQSGRHTFTFSWKATGNNSGDFNGGNPLQATYSAFSDASSPADDSGPITQAFIGNSSTGQVDVNSLQQGSSQSTLTVSFLLQGLALSGPNDPPVILRTSVNNRKATGDFDCGQGTGAQGLHDAIVNGCPDPVSIYDPTQGCVFLPATPLTCANLVPGSKRGQADQAWIDRVESAQLNGTPSACDMWQAYKTGTAISGFEPWDASVPDSRIIVMAVTAPTDLSGGGGPTNSVKILGFATFYITGFDKDPWLPNKNGNGGTKIPNCSAPTNADEAYPGTGTPGQGEIWGHFIKYVAAGTSNSQPCKLTDVSVCVPALTR